MHVVQEGTLRKDILVLKKCDIFGQQVNLNYKKEDTYRTIFGGFSSLVIIVVVVVFFQSNVVTFFAKTQITATETTYFHANPDQIVLNDDNFMLALSIQQANFSTNPYFNLTAKQLFYTRLENGTLIKNSSNINLIPCTVDRFDKVFKKFKVNFTEQYNSLGFNTWLCPDYGFTLNLSGVYASDLFEFIKIQVTDCSNKTEHNSFFTWKPVCQSSEAVKKYLTTQTSFSVQLYMTNLVINPALPENYITAFLDDELYFTFVIYQVKQTPKELFRSANIFWRNYDFNIDNSLTPFEEIENSTYLVRSRTDFRDLTELGTSTDTVYATFYFRRSPYTENILRSYLKVDSLMSYLGGFMQIMIVFFGFFIQVYNRQSQLVDLSNELFDFQIDEESNNKELISNVNHFDFQGGDSANQSMRQVSNSLYNNKSGQMKKSCKSAKTIKQEGGGTSVKQLDSIKDFTPLSQMTINNQQLVEKHQSLMDSLNGKNGRQYFLEKIQNIYQKTKKLKFSLKFFVQKLFCENMMKNPQILLLNKAVNKINMQLDIFEILDKLNEIDKLKELLLKKPQQIIFNFTPKPLISLRETKELPSRQKAATLKSSQKHISSSQKVGSSIKIGLDQISKQMVNQQDELLPRDSPQYIYSKLFKAYEQIMILIENEDEDIYLNNQLIKKLGPQVQSIFEISWLLNQQQQNEKDIQVNDRAKKLIQSKFSKLKGSQQQQQVEQESDGECSPQEIDIEILCSPKAQDQQNVLSRVIGKGRSNEF